jgi:hypothetical protein
MNYCVHIYHFQSFNSVTTTNNLGLSQLTTRKAWYSYKTTAYTALSL